MKKAFLIFLLSAATFAACSPMMESETSMEGSSDTQMNDTTMESRSMDSEEGVMVGGAMMTRDKDIVDNAVNSKDHTTLVAAVKAAGLVDTLKSEGPYTVFAPTNMAFGKLPDGTVEDLLKPENKQMLTGVLTYHVVPGMYTSADLENGQTLETVNGQTITLTQKNGQWYVNDTAMITISDAVSSNGVTHVIDTVLMPQ